MSDETNKTETEETVKTVQEQLSPAQLEKRRVDGIEFYGKQSELLESQLKYETLKADVQEQKTRCTLALAQQMSMFQQDPGEPEEHEPSKTRTPDVESDPSKKERTLAEKS